MITSVQITAQYTAIPDANFEAALDALGYDDISGDGQVPTNTIEVITTLELNNQNISDLTGINDFVALESLKLQYNNLTSLDVSSLINLRVLWASNGNIFSSIDVSNNTALEDFRIRQYTGTSIDLSSLTLLKRFSCTSCDLTSLDTSNNPNLNYLDLWNSDISTLDLSTNTSLATLDVYSTKLNSLDLSKNTSLISLIANDIAALTSLNVQNGNNTNVTKFQVSGNTGLTCINVDDAAYSTTNWTDIDAGMYFSTYNCRYTQIPDANFEARLNALGYDDIANDGQVPTDLIEVVTELQLAGQNITDLTGIEDFTALEELKANGNNITSIDLSNNTALKLFQMTSSSSLGSINVSNNPVLADLQIRSLNSSIDISNLSALDRFACVDCTFTTLNTSGNPNLRHLDLEDTPVTAIDVSTNTKLEILELENTKLVELDLSKNTSFKYLYAQDITTLSTLNIQNGNNTNISAFDILGTPVFCVLVDDTTYSTTNWTNIESTTLFSETNCNYTAIPDATFEAVLESQGYDNISGDGQVPTFLIESLTVLNISSKGISDLTGIEDFVALEELKANQNDLTSINLTNNPALRVLWIRQGNNNFSSIDVSKNTALEDFRIQYSGTSLDISNNTALTQFMCTDCSLTSLNTSSNTNLNYLDLEGSDITALDLSTNINLTGLEIDKTRLITLDLSKNASLKYLYADNITSLTSLNIQNGANTNISAFETVGTPVPCVVVDDVAYSTTNWTDVEATTRFNVTNCNYTTIPDPNFESALNNLGYDDVVGDGKVPTSLIEAVTVLDVSNQNISDLTGIQDFTALTDLNCEINTLTTLDVSTNSNLQKIVFDENNITTINFGANTNLNSIEGRYNQLSSIDITQNTGLTFINIRNNLFSSINVSNNTLLETINIRECTNVTSIDVSSNTNLKFLYLQDVGLTDIDITQNTLLEVITLERNNLSAIDVSNNTALRQLRVSENNITRLDASNNTALTRLSCDNNQLTFLNAQNGNNTAIANGDFNATGNTDLKCIKVDDSAWSTTNWTNIDSGVSFYSTGVCRYTTIPDSNFEVALENLGYDDISGDGKVPTENIESVTDLDLRSKTISDLTGIEDFIAIKSLNLKNNSLTSIDLTNNADLETLGVSENDLTSIDLSKNLKLTNLDIGANPITSIDVSNNTSLTRLECPVTDITSIDVSNLTQLTFLELFQTDITTLDVSNNLVLKNLILYRTNLTSLNLSLNTELTQLRIDYTDILAIDLTSNTKLVEVRINGSDITTIDLTNQVALTDFYGQTGALEYINIKNGNNTNIVNFDVRNNNDLTCVTVDDATYSTTNWTNISSSTSFTEGIYCDYTDIPDANFEARLEALGHDDISGDGKVPTKLIEEVTSLTINGHSVSDFTGIEDFTGLTYLDVGNNDITSLDVSNLTLLTFLRVDGNSLTSLDLSKNTLLVDLRCSYNAGITSLNLSNNTLLETAHLGNNSLASLDLSSNPFLYDLRLTGNDLTSISLTNNTALQTLIVSNNPLTTLDLTANTALTSLYATNCGLISVTNINTTVLQNLYLQKNNLTSIDFSSSVGTITNMYLSENSLTELDFTGAISLKKLSVYENNISSLEVTQAVSLEEVYVTDNDLTYFNVKNGNNTAIHEFHADNNPSLTCILVDDAATSTTRWVSGIDDTASFSDTYCRYTAIPDSIFEARLEALGYDDISGDGQVPTKLIEVVTSLNLNDIGISDLTGIEDFTALVTLNARGNNFTTIDVSNNILLETLTVNTNNLTTIDVSKNVALRILNLGTNLFTSVDVSKNVNLRDLFVQGNSGLTSLDLSNNTQLQNLYTTNTNIASLDISLNSNLKTLEVYKTPIANIDLSNNPDITTLRIDETNITEIDLSNNVNIETLRVNDTGIETLDLSKLTSLEKLWAHDTSLNYLNVKNGNNTNVLTFRIENNPNLTCAIVDDPSYSTTNWTDIPSGFVFSTTYCDYTSIPDANFEAALEALGYDDISGDGQVPTPLIEVVEDLTIVSKSIADITGIEDFKALKTLNCAGNTFTSLNLSNNTELTSVITKFTPIATLNISNSVHLDMLVCSFNNLTTLDVSNNIALTYLECNNNNLTALNVSNNVALQDLRCGSNSLTAIDVTYNTALTSFWCQDNAITDLDLSNQTGLVSITVNNNSLTNLNVKNGNNTNVTNFIATGNINLTCINVDDVTYSTTNWLGIDNTANFSSTGCSYTQIPDANFEAELEALGYDDISGDGQVPTYLIEVVTSLALPNRGISDLTGIEDFVALTSLNCRVNNLTALDVTQNTLLKTLTADGNSITSIDLSNNTDLEILNLAGSNLTSIDLTNNSSLRKLLLNGNGGLTSLDISKNTKLVEFKAYATNITALDFSVHPDIETLECYGTQISTINLSNSPDLRVLRVDNTNITALDLSNNPNIETLRVNDTGIQILDLTNQTALKNLYAHDTSLTSLNVKNGNNTNVTTFRAEGNPNLTCIVVDNVTYSTNNWTDIDGTASFTNSYCRYTTIPDANFEAALEGLGYDDISSDGQVPTDLIKGITSLEVNNQSITDFTGIEDFVGLTHLDVGNNSAGSIDITNLVLLEFVRLDAMSLTSIDLSKNTALVDLRCSFNSGLTSIDVSNNTLLETAHIGNNSLTSINLNNNPLLYELRLSHNNLTSVDLSSNTALTELNITNNDLSYLNLKNANNIKIVIFYSTGNPSLSCVLVDDANYSTTNWTNIDNTTSFSDTYCRYTAIPDTSFEARLDALGYDDVSGDGQVPTALIENVTYLYVPVNAGTPITSLSGIEDFVSLERLICSGSRLTSIDLSNSPNLTEANLSNNNLTSISINGLTALENLQLGGNNLSSIDVTTNTVLIDLDLRGSDITTLNVTNNTALETLDIGSNEISTIDLSNNTVLESFTFSSTPLTSLDLSNNINLYYVEGEYANNLTELDLSALPLLDEVYLNDCALLTSINIKNGKNTDISDFETTGSPNLTCILVDDETYSTTNWTSIDDHTSFNNISCEQVQVAIKVYLQGAYLNPNTGEESLMRDDLRVSGGVYGSTSPYSDSATISDAIKVDDAGSDSMVDWVWVELRDANDSSIVIAQKSGVLQRDGDIVDVTDSRNAPLTFSVASNNYYIVVKHRNHLSVMTSSPTSLSSTSTTLDLTSNANLVSGGANALVDMGSGIFAMISGDFDENGQIQNIDTNDVIQLLGVSGYNKADLDMNGQVQNADINNLLNPNIGKGEQF
ncbi:conserved hypothetical protein [Tenacibaculum sp. 190524A05c]|uniref:hypothetical protein n=1 Tax=Tenacibaculum platacis TaxID=3137852 RepID=UPI0031FAACAC